MTIKAAVLFILILLSSLVSGCSSPTAPELPCNIYVRTDPLPTPPYPPGSYHIVWTNARGEDCSPLKPVTP